MNAHWHGYWHAKRDEANRHATTVQSSDNKDGTYDSICPVLLDNSSSVIEASLVVSELIHV